MSEMSEEEQKYFDTAGEEGPETETVETEHAAVEQGTEQQVEQETEQQEEQTKDETVSREQYDQIHRAMDSERHKAREVKQQYEEEKQEWNEKLARLDERLQILNKQFGYEEEVDESDQVKTALNQQQQTIAEQQQQLQQMQVAQTLNMQETMFSQQTPDYEKAKQHYLTTRRDTMMAMGYSEEQATDSVITEIRGMVDVALNSQSNAAERLYQAAQKLGFKGEVAAKVEKSEQKLEQIDKGQVTQMPTGGAPRAPLTVEELANMPEDEFAKLSDDVIKQVMSG
jgi:hypothetical protein